MREEAERIDVGLAGADPDPEMDVRLGILGISRRAWLRDGVALAHGGATPETKRP